LGQIDVLVAIAGEAGLNESDARSALEADSYRTAVEADVAQAAHFGISGVPFYVIDGKYGISGAQGSDIFASALAEAAAARTS
jgi:predicted DsbA family dithiol-disulfide isomerase